MNNGVFYATAQSKSRVHLVCCVTKKELTVFKKLIGDDIYCLYLGSNGWCIDFRRDNPKFNAIMNAAVFINGGCIKNAPI